MRPRQACALESQHCLQRFLHALLRVETGLIVQLLIENRPGCPQVGIGEDQPLDGASFAKDPLAHEITLPAHLLELPRRIDQDICGDGGLK